MEAAGRKALALQTNTADEAANDAMIAACVAAFARWTCWWPPRAWEALGRTRTSRARSVSRHSSALSDGRPAPTALSC